IGFTSHSNHSDEKLADLDRKLYRTALETAKRKFSPEFMNRLDKVVVFRTLTAADMRQILDIELNEVQTRIMSLQNDNQFIFPCTPDAKDFLLQEGTNVKYGARHLKRAIERHLVFPLSNLIATGQIRVGDVINIDLGSSEDKLSFSKEHVISGMAPSETLPALGLAARRPVKGDMKDMKVMAGIK